MSTAFDQSCLLEKQTDHDGMNFGYLYSLFFFSQPRGINATKRKTLCICAPCVKWRYVVLNDVLDEAPDTQCVSVVLKNYFFFSPSFLSDDYFNLYLWKYTTCNM